jgi:hypothetical protein
MTPLEFSMGTKRVSKYVRQQAESWQRKGARNVYTVEQGSSKESINVMFTF